MSTQIIYILVYSNARHFKKYSSVAFNVEDSKMCRNSSDRELLYFGVLLIESSGMFAFSP